MKQIVGRVVTQAGRRGVPDLLVTAFGTNPDVSDVRIGTVFTDDEGKFDFGPVFADPISGFHSIYLRVETPASQLSGSQIAPVAVTHARPNPGTIEAFLIPVAESALTSEGRDHFVPTGLPAGLSAPVALVTRAAQVAKHRDEIAASLQAASAQRIDLARAEIDKAETKIRQALASLPEATPTSRPRHLVFETSDVRDATFASIAATGTTLTGTTQFAKLALTADELDTLRVTGDSLDAAKVERILFGPEPEREGLVRTRLDVLRADCERRQRRAPVEPPTPPSPPTPWDNNAAYSIGDRVLFEHVEYECVRAHTSRSEWRPDLTPALWKRVGAVVRSSSGTWSATGLVALKDAVKIMVDAAARGIVIPGDRDTPGSLAEKIATLSVGRGPADAPALFDYNVLGVAFEHLWRRQVDEHVVETATELHDQLVLVGGRPTIRRGSQLFTSLRQEAQAVIKAGIHVAETAALSGYSEAPDFDLLTDERRIRARDHRGATHYRSTRTASNIRDHREHPGGWNPGPSTPPPTWPPPRPSTPPYQTPVPPVPARLKELVEELESRMSEPYCFEVFAATPEERSVNFGVLFGYRQTWLKTADQAGPLVRTVTLAPGEEKTFTIRETTKKSTSITESRLDESQEHVETADTTRDVKDIVNAAKTSLGFHAEGMEKADYKMGSASSSWDVTRNVEQSSQETRQAFREAVRKASQDHKTSRKLEVTTSESTETFREESGKLVNRNDELPVTYLFFELQRRFRVSEIIHRLTPVILVAQEVPAPHEITRGWLLQHDWILHKALLDESFRPALKYLRDDSAGAEIRLGELKTHLEGQRKIVSDLRDELVALERDLTSRYGALARALRASGSAAASEADEGLIEKSIEFFIGEVGPSVERAKAREDAARDAWERAVQAEREARDRLAAAVNAVELATRDYVEAEAAFENSELGVLRLRVHVKQNILHYMQAIWDHEQRDQRVFRLFESEVPLLAGHIDYSVASNVGAPPIPPLWIPAWKVKAELTVDAVTESVQLGTIADLDRPLGYRGNYMIFPLKRHNVLTRFMSVPYADTLGSLHDPVDAANYTIGDLDHYVECLRDTMSEANFDAIRPKIEELYDYVLSSPYPTEDEIVIPSGSLFIEALPGSAPVLEDFKLLHRAVDVSSAAAAVRGRELNNLRYAARILDDKLGDPDIETVVVTDPKANVLIDGNGGPQ